MRKSWWKREAELITLAFVCLFSVIAEFIHFLSPNRLGPDKPIFFLLLGMAAILGRFMMMLKEVQESAKEISATTKSVAESMAEDTEVLDFSDRPKKYQQIADMLDRPCGKIFLMQSSSSLILGWEKGSQDEKAFYDKLIEKIKDEKTEFYHVVRLKGIQTDLSSQSEKFTNIGEAFARLRDDHGTICVQGEVGTRPRELKWFDQEDYKQGRVLFVETREHNSAEAYAFIAFDVGKTQFTLRLRGAKARRYLDDFQNFYNGCKFLTVKALYREVPQLKKFSIQPL